MNDSSFGQRVFLKKSRLSYVLEIPMIKAKILISGIFLFILFSAFLFPAKSYSDEDVKKIMGGNLLHVWKKVTKQ